MQRGFGLSKGFTVSEADIVGMFKGRVSFYREVVSVRHAFVCGHGDELVRQGFVMRTQSAGCHVIYDFRRCCHAVAFSQWRTARISSSVTR